MKYLAILALIVAQALACNPPTHIVKRMMAAEARQGFSTITKEHLASRELSRATGAWRSLNILFDQRPLNKKLTELGKASLIPFYEKVFNATGAWWKNAVKVNDDRSKIKQTIEQAVTDEAQGQENWAAPADVDMTEYDLLVLIDWADEAGNEATLAWAYVTARHPDSQRPIGGAMSVEKFGNGLWEKNTDRKRAFQEAMATMIHEFGHIIAYLGWEKFQPHNILTIPGTDGKNGYEWKGPKVLEIARKYYNCSADLKGLPLERMTDGSLGAHWEEAWFGPEGMSPVGGAEPELFSAMSLALCQDSGWYQVDYAMAENYEFGKGTGCDKKNCAKQTCNPQTDTNDLISSKKTSLGYCNKDEHNCGSYTPYTGRNCKTATGWPTGNQAYGASYSDDCTVVRGAFTAFGTDGSQYSITELSVEATCSADQQSYSLMFKGAEYVEEDKKTGQDVIVACKAAGDVAYNYLSLNVESSVKCEDPKSFCKARFGGQELCPDMCSNSGRCAHQANNTAGPVDFKTLVSRKMLGGTRTISLSDSGSDIASANDWACWCFKSGRFSTEASGSCPKVF